LHTGFTFSLPIWARQVFGFGMGDVMELILLLPTKFKPRPVAELVFSRPFYYETCYFLAGASIPLWGNDSFSPCFGFFPRFPKHFSDSVENFPNFTFSRKISRFSSAKISDDLFLSHRLKILIPPPIFTVSLHFPLFRENYYSPYFCKFPPLFSGNLCVFYILYVYFVSLLLWPWCIFASHNARTGRSC